MILSHITVLDCVDRDTNQFLPLKVCGGYFNVLRCLLSLDLVNSDKTNKRDTQSSNSVAYFGLRISSKLTEFGLEFAGLSSLLAAAVRGVAQKILFESRTTRSMSIPDKERKPSTNGQSTLVVMIVRFCDVLYCYAFSSVTCCRVVSCRVVSFCIVSCCGAMFCFDVLYCSVLTVAVCCCVMFSCDVLCCVGLCYAALC